MNLIPFASNVPAGPNNRVGTCSNQGIANSAQAKIDIRIEEREKLLLEIAQSAAELIRAERDWGSGRDYVQKVEIAAARVHRLEGEIEFLQFAHDGATALMEADEG